MAEGEDETGATEAPPDDGLVAVKLAEGIVHQRRAYQAGETLRVRPHTRDHLKRRGKLRGK